VSNTFHGRDVFGAVAGWLSKGVEVAKFGDEIGDYVRFAAPRPKPVDNKLLKGIVLKVDKFGNLITNITPADLPQLFAPNPPPFKVLIGKHEISKLTQSYAEGTPGEVFVVLNSMGFLEIACHRGAATQIVGAGKGADVGVLFESAQIGAVTP